MDSIIENKGWQPGLFFTGFFMKLNVVSVGEGIVQE